MGDGPARPEKIQQPFHRQAGAFDIETVLANDLLELRPVKLLVEKRVTNLDQTEPFQALADVRGYDEFMQQSPVQFPAAPLAFVPAATGREFAGLDVAFINMFFQPTQIVSLGRLRQRAVDEAAEPQ